jgi:hypothetical protein
MAWLVALTVACGPRTDPGDGSGGGTATTASSTGPGATSMATADSTATSGDVAPPAGCRCQVPVEDGSTCEALAHTECDGEALCSVLYSTCTRPNPDLYMCDPASVTYDEAILACILEALRDRTPGKVSMAIENDECGLEGCGRTHTELTILPDDVAVRRSCIASPLGAEVSWSTLATLDEPAHFDGCLARPTPQQRFTCLLSGISYGADLCE